MSDRVAVPYALVGEARVPGDESIAHRTLLLGALAEGTSQVRGLWGSRVFTDIEEVRFNTTFALNDLVTSEDSAHSPFGTYLGSEDANHSSMKSTSLANRILQRIVADFPNHF